MHTGFIQDAFGLGRGLSLTLGAKLQHNNYSGFDIQPSGRLLWTVKDHESVWLGMTRAVTTPSDLEENYSVEEALAPKEFLQLAGNKNFKSEDVLGYEAGYRAMLHDRLYIDLSGFWNQYSRLQSFSAPMVSASGGITYLTIQYQNQISGFASGFEIAPQLGIAPWWHINSSYSYVSSNFKAIGATSDISSTGSVSTYEKSSPKHQVMLQSKIELPAHFEFDQMYRFVSSLAAQKVEAYQTMDVHLAKTLGRGFSIAAVGQNLFQPHHYEWGTGDPSQALVGIYRSGYFQLSWQGKGPKGH